MENSPQRQKADLWLLEGSREGWGEGLTKETFWEGCIFSPFWLWWLFHVYQDSPSCLSWMESLLSVDVQFIACRWYLNKAIEIFKIRETDKRVFQWSKLKMKMILSRKGQWGIHLHFNSEVNVLMSRVMLNVKKEKKQSRKILTFLHWAFGCVVVAFMKV